MKRYMNKYHKHVCITSEIQDNEYDELMNWLESKCDSFSFCLPHFGKVVVTESNADIYPEYEIGYVEEDEESKKDYEQYRRRVQKYLENISEYIIENYVDIEYCETISGYEKEIFIIKLNNITKKFFENVKDLYGWLYPEFPEDLSFYIDGKLYMRSIAHERICEFYSESKELKRFLKNNGLQFCELKY